MSFRHAHSAGPLPPDRTIRIDLPAREHVPPDLRPVLQAIRGLRDRHPAQQAPTQALRIVLRGVVAAIGLVVPELWLG